MDGYEVIILAGGLGTRLRSAVADVPKCMAPVAGRPFLWYLLDGLRGTRASRVILSVGYLKEVIFDWLDPSEWPFEIDWAVEGKPLGTGGGIRLALSKCKGNRVAVLNGDTLYDVSLDALMEDGDAPVRLALKPMEAFDRYGAVELDGRRITAFREKAWCRKGLINGGVYAIDREALDLSSFPEKFSFEKDVLEPMAAEGRLEGVVDEGYFIDIGIPEDYARARQELPEIQAVRSADRRLRGGEGWTLLLDRDGVVNRQIKGDYVRNWDRFVFLPGVLKALRGWASRFDRILVVTNQRGVGRGLMTREDLDAIHARMIASITTAGGRIDGIYVSTAVEEDDPSRKPRTGLFEAALRDWPDMDPERCVMVGDTDSDEAFARNCGIGFVRMGG
jgi:D-glycero-alpha-D-manno-heptose 1-phosphate guanylyltransferase